MVQVKIITKDIIKNPQLLSNLPIIKTDTTSITFKETAILSNDIGLFKTVEREVIAKEGNTIVIHDDRINVYDTEELLTALIERIYFLDKEVSSMQSIVGESNVGFFLDKDD